MEGNIPQTDLQPTPLAFDGNPNFSSQIAENYTYHQYVKEAGGYGSQYVAPHLPQWTQCQQTPHNYVEFLAENVVSELQGKISYTNSAVASNNYIKPAESFTDKGSQKVRYTSPLFEKAPVSDVSSTEHKIHAQDLQRQELNGGHHNSLPPLPEAAVSNTHLLHKPRTSSRQRSAEADRRRKIRIGAALNALQELLPQPRQSRRATLPDDINDYIKYLQLQIKELSENRLGGEPTSYPFIFLEGHGHYLLHENMLGEPLEEMMGKLLEVNPSAAGQLLQTRGLFMMPQTFAEGS